VFSENRTERRYWCSDLVRVWTKDGARWKSAGVGILEDISATGACLQLEVNVKKDTPIRFKHPEWTAEGVVRHCYWREIGYFVGMEFSDKSRWSPDVFRPKHMVDPAALVSSRIQRKSRAAGSGS
jgi:hypothetical protein